MLKFDRLFTFNLFSFLDPSHIFLKLYHISDGITRRRTIKKTLKKMKFFFTSLLNSKDLALLTSLQGQEYIVILGRNFFCDMEYQAAAFRLPRFQGYAR